MTYISETLGNGNTISYQVTESGTAYHAETPIEVVNILERARYRGQRLKFYYGDRETGKDWNEEHDTIGYIGRTGGKIQIPILLHNNKSIGGGAILDHCIVKIKEAKGNYVLYTAPNYKPSTIEIVPSDLPEYSHNLEINGTLYSRHKTYRSAQLLKNKLS